MTTPLRMIWTTCVCCAIAGGTNYGAEAQLAGRLQRDHRPRTYVKPALPQLGAAGFTFNDPVFGSKSLRVTDGYTRPGTTNRSYRVPSNAHLSAWNSSSTIVLRVEQRRHVESVRSTRQPWPRRASAAPAR